MERNRSARNCSNCLFAFFWDYGYSNYTTEGTYFYCGLFKHPNAPFDRFYNEDKRLTYAKYCKRFTKGIPLEVDVETDRISEKMPLIQRTLWPKVRDSLAPSINEPKNPNKVKYKWER